MHNNDPLTNFPSVQTNIPGPKSLEHWQQEEQIIGPGLQAVVQWVQLCIVEGHGSYLVDLDGNTYVDFMGASGVNSLGHSHPRFIEALSEQLSTWVTGGFASQARLKMLQLMQTVLPPGLEKIQLYSSGSEAVEAGLRLAKSYTQKHEFLGFWNAFHGKTMGSLALTDGAKRGLGPLVPGFYSAPYAYCYRCPFQLKFPSCSLACVEHVRDVIRHETTGALAAIIIEPVQGRAGNIEPPPGYLSAIQSVAREFDALLIADESITGFGRTGKMFACEHDGVSPDIIIVGKGMGNGFPVTGIISNSQIMSASPYSDPSASSSSYGGFPLACQAIAVTLHTIIEENLVWNSAVLGRKFLSELTRMVQEISIVGDVRGRGLMLGVEIVYDKETKRPVPKEIMRQVYLALLKEGVLVMVGGNSLRLYPPLSINDDLVAKVCTVIEKTLREQARIITSDLKNRI